MHNMHLFYQHNTVCLECFRRVSECTDRSIDRLFVRLVGQSIFCWLFVGVNLKCVCVREFCAGGDQRITNLYAHCVVVDRGFFVSRFLLLLVTFYSVKIKISSWEPFFKNSFNVTKKHRTHT